MDDTISFNTIKKSFTAILNRLEENRQFLNDLDSPIGDSDHGESVTAAFKKVKEAVDAYPADQNDIGSLLQLERQLFSLVELQWVPFMVLLLWMLELLFVEKAF